MQDAACSRDDVVAAYHDVRGKLDQRCSQLWSAYLDATREELTAGYDATEQECWSVLQAGLTGLEAEYSVAEREFEKRVSSFDDADRVA